MTDFREMVIDMGRIQQANARAKQKHIEFQIAMSENKIYPEDRHDSDAEEFSRPLNWQEEQAKDIEELEESES